MNTSTPLVLHFIHTNYESVLLTEEKNIIKISEQANKTKKNNQTEVHQPFCKWNTSKSTDAKKNVKEKKLHGVYLYVPANIQNFIFIANE